MEENPNNPSQTKEVSPQVSQSLPQKTQSKSKTYLNLPKENPKITKNLLQ
jgi:hypothetical protein